MTTAELRRRDHAGWGRVLKRPQFRLGAGVLIIAFGWYAIFVFGPVLRGFAISVQEFSILDPSSSPFVGLENFRALFGYDRFWISVGNTVVYTVVKYLIEVPLSLLLAWCITSVSRGRRFFEFVVFLPVVVSLVAISMLFRMLMNPDSGIFNKILGTLSLPTSRWIFGEESALASVVLVDVWKGLGFYVVLLAAAMLAVPKEQQEAALIDGASAWRVFRHVTIPSIMPTLALVSILTIHNGLSVYVTPVVLGPGPGTSTLLMNQFIVDTAFESFDMSLATAGSLVLFVFVLILTALQLRITRSKA